MYPNIYLKIYNLIIIVSLNMAKESVLHKAGNSVEKIQQRADFLTKMPNMWQDLALMKYIKQWESSISKDWTVKMNTK